MALITLGIEELAYLEDLLNDKMGNEDDMLPDQILRKVDEALQRIAEESD